MIGFRTEKKRSFWATTAFCGGGALLGTLTLGMQAWATTIPGPADASRLDRRERLFVPEKDQRPMTMPLQVLPSAKAPEESKSITITIKTVRLVGDCLFPSEKIRSVYEPYLHKEVTLDTVWTIANLLTKLYRDEGYFLSRVVVPEQGIDDGIVTFKVIEGYIGTVAFDDPLVQNTIVRAWIDSLLAQRPIKSDQLESVLLQLNDLPGVRVRAILRPGIGDEGAVQLVLERQDVPMFSGEASADNYNSRFLGPYEAVVRMQAVLWPMHRTSVALLSSLPWEKVKYGSIRHEISVFPAGTIALYGSYTPTTPGYTLRAYDVKSQSTTLGGALDYALIRQRRENLTARVAFEWHKTHTDLLNTVLVEDNTRVMRFSATYQNADAWHGENSVGAGIAQGLDLFGASKVGAPNLSRSDARPDFTKFNLMLSRTQSLPDGWQLRAALAGQFAIGPLYSSEQFGYGGQVFGRAYDDSEIMGDHGLAGAVEVRYMDLPSDWKLRVIPYAFYDRGAVWNAGPTATFKYASGSSAGIGIRAQTSSGVYGTIGMAFPLTRKIENPIYGNGKNPRFFAQISFLF
ncbi:MAG: ShlB/FhaC/HecB family hemolysin secretion/activation protein [Alphaproteobacteria bacterium]|nr:ShlB/FhaC/HecB family hemolysin secretion/activation protein [Alphaproteobacteria bacterium]